MKNRFKNSNINILHSNNVETVPTPTITIKEDELEKMKRSYIRVK